MKILRKILDSAGWHVRGPDVPIQVGVKFGDSAPGPPHFHRTMHEYFLVLAGTISLSIVGGEEVTLGRGDLLIMEPGEPHAMTSKSPDAHYILLMPSAVENDKVIIS